MYDSNAALERGYKSESPLKTFWRLLGIPWWQHLSLLALYFVKMSPHLLLPFVIAESIRVAGSDMSDKWGYLLYVYGAYLVITLANLPLHVWFVRGSSKIYRRMELELRAALVRRLQTLSMRFHGETESGRLQSKVLRDVEEVTRLGEFYFQTAMGAFLGLIFAFTYTIFQEPLVALAYLVAAPLCVGLDRTFRRAMRKSNDAYRFEFEGMSQRVSEMIDMVPVTRAHGVEEEEMARVQSQLKHVRERGRRVDAVNSYFGASSYVVFLCICLLVIGGVTWLVTQGQLGIDKIALYAALFQTIVGSIQGLLGMLPQVMKSISSIRSIGEILECPDLEENEGKYVVDHVEGHIDFRKVGYKYTGQENPAVVDFSLHVQPGDCVAFVGESGSGKSTLMQLSIGFLRPQNGQILLDGRPMESIDMRSWRRQIAMVPQHTILYSGTIRDNISYGLKEFSEADVWRAIDIANLRDVIEELPQGLDTLIGENGLKLSGGQRQRLAIARAVIRDPRVIVLDEATSALDAISERDVQLAIENLIRGRTTFIVAHRLSTIRQANRVVVMKRGRMIEVGSPEELVALKGVFAELKSLQIN